MNGLKYYNSSIPYCKLEIAIHSKFKICVSSHDESGDEEDNVVDRNDSDGLASKILVDAKQLHLNKINIV